MTDEYSRASTRNSKFIKAAPEVIYRAFTDPATLAIWLAPGDMTGAIHHFDGRVGGGYEMSLYLSRIRTNCTRQDRRLGRSLYGAVYGTDAAAQHHRSDHL